MSNQEVEPVSEQESSALETCPRCRKQITPESRRGTFTAYLFAANRCQCSLPKAPEVQRETLPQASAEPGTALADDREIPSTPELGERYEVLELIGQGGMGSVWKVRDTNIDKTLAVKVLRAELAADNIAVKRFEQEVQAASSLTQANLVAVYGSGKTLSECPYMVMDYLEGKNLAEILSSEIFFSPTRVLDLTSQICMALIHAHAKGVVHRDLKPSNIIVIKGEGGNDFVKIVDFGIAKIMPSVKEQTSNLTQTGDLFGSPLYMSPEQCQGEVIDARSDLYSLGCIMYELLSGKQAFAAENPIKVILRQLTEKPEALPAGNYPDGLVEVVYRCLEKDPDERYWTSQELLEDVQSIASGGVPLKRGEKTKLKLLTADSCFRRYCARAIDGLFVGLVSAAVSFAAATFAWHYGMTSWPDRVPKSAEVIRGMAWTFPMIFFGLGVMDEFFPILVPLALMSTYTLFRLGASHDALALYRSVISCLLMDLCFLGPVIFGWLYHVWLEKSPMKATLGKRLMGIKVTDIRDQPLSFGRASARYFAKVLSLSGLTDSLLYPLYRMRASRKRLPPPDFSDFFFRRPLHDRLCRAFVSQDSERLELIERPLPAAFVTSTVVTLFCFTPFIAAISAMSVCNLPDFQTPGIICRFLGFDLLVFTCVYAFKKLKKSSGAAAIEKSSSN